MADTKISALTAATAPDAAAVLPYAKSGANGSLTGRQLGSITPAMCRVTRSADQSITSAVWTIVQWTVNDIDDTSSAAHSTSSNNTRLIVPSGYSRARIVAYSNWANSTSGNRYLGIFKNAAGSTSASYMARSQNAVNETGLQIDTGWMSVTGGTDYFEIGVLQTSGGALALSGVASNWGGVSWATIELAV